MQSVIRIILSAFFLLSVSNTVSAQGTFVSNGITGNACINQPEANETYSVNFPNVTGTPSFGYDYYIVSWSFTQGELSPGSNINSNPVTIKWANNSATRSLTATVYYYQSQWMGYDEYGYDIYQDVMVVQEYSTLDISFSPTFFIANNLIYSALGNALNTNWFFANLIYNHPLAYSYNSTTVPFALEQVFAFSTNPALCGVPTYQWESSSSFNGPFTAISAATNDFYAFPAAITETVFFRRKLFGVNGFYTYSNIVKIEAVSQGWENQNYLREHTVLVPGIIDWHAVDQLPIGQKQQQTTYYDGLGRNIQSVQREIAVPTTGSLWGDVVNFMEYDEFGRQVDQYLGYSTTTESGKYKTGPATEQQQYYSINYGETAPYNHLTFNNSPQNRVTNIKQPGTSWAAGLGNTETYMFNTQFDNVQILWVGLNSGDIPESQGLYPDNTLIKKITTDENGKQVVQYVNRSGQLILKKIQLDDDPTLSNYGWICNYYVYDDFGQLRYAIQPEAVKYLDLNSWSFAGVEGQKVLEEWCFRYEYNAKGKNVLKKAPGTDKLLLLHDKRGRSVFMQDANQRLKSPPEWTVTLYDELDRATITLLYRTDKSQQAIQTDIDNATSTSTVTVSNAGQAITDLVVNNRQLGIPRYAASNSIEFIDDHNGNFESLLNDEFVAEIDPNATSSTYTLTTTAYLNPISNSDLANPAKTTILKHFFYDNYSYPNVKAFSTNFDNAQAYNNSDPAVMPIVPTRRTSGMVTGTMTRVLGTNSFLSSYFYYDERGQGIQNISENIKSGLDIATSQNHFDGRLLSVSSKHTAALTGYSNFSILTKYNFDKLGRVTSIDKTYGNNTIKKIASYEYTDMGRPKTKHLLPGPLNSTTGKNELESLNYSYNIHGQITGVNKDYALKTPLQYDKWSNYFGYFIGYDQTAGVFSNTNLNGQIAGQIWNTMGDDAQRKYEYTYDNAGRLINAIFNERQQVGDSWVNNKIDFSVTGRGGMIEYDLNGNLLYMLQKGVMIGNSTPVKMDDLEYTYSPLSNKLIRVADKGNLGTLNGSLNDFKDGANPLANDDYVYDDNGNLIVDLNKGIKDLPSGGQSTALGTSGITYNFQDKPEFINIANKGTIKIVYDADGNKLQKIYTPLNTGITKTTSYVNGFVYEGNDLQYLNFEEGRIRTIVKVDISNGYDFLNIDGTITLPGGKRGVFDCFIKDHLGNVRMVLTDESHIGGNVCTMETQNPNRSANEEPVFGQVNPNGSVNTATNEVYITRTLTSTTPWSGNSSQYVSKVGKLATSKIGPNTLMPVMSGDVINATVKYFYQNPVDNSGYSSVGSTLLTNLAFLIQTSLANHNPTGSLLHEQAGAINSQISGTSLLPGQVASNSSTTDSKAKAYLTVLFFDERFNFVAENSLSVQVGNAGASAIPPFSQKAPKNGYAYVYISNESDEPVYFDDFQVSHYHARIIEESHYYAYGLKMVGISSSKMPDAAEGNIKNKYLYNDKELWDEGGLNWYDYGFRNYDPQIGRFIQLDPLTFEYPFLTPYQYASCEPIANIDRDGLEKVVNVVFEGYEDAVGQILEGTAAQLKPLMEKFLTTAGYSSVIVTNDIGWFEKAGRWFGREVVPRLAGALRTAAGVAIMTLGAPLVQLGVGVPIVLFGADIAASGAQQMIDGRKHRTISEEVLISLNMPEDQAEVLVDLASAYLSMGVTSSSATSAEINAFNKSVPKKYTVAAEPEFRGGAYGSMEGKAVTNLEKHHVPADAVSPLSKAKGAAIQMTPEDHALTGSYKNTKSAQVYRQKQKAFIESGNFKSAFEMDVNDIQSKFGTKYNSALEEAKSYYKTTGTF